MDASTSKDEPTPGHVRTASHARRQAMPRRTTRGPLDDEADDPLSQKPSPSPQYLTVSQPRPGGQSRSPSRSPTRPSQSGGGGGGGRKNFAFLLRPDIFHALDDEDGLGPLRDQITTETPETVLSKCIAEGNFRTAATLAADMLKSKSDPSDASSIFALVHARLVCLQLSGLEDMAARESRALQDMNAPVYRDETSGRNAIPWALRNIVVRLQAIGFGDWRRAIMAFYDLAREARFEHRRAKKDDSRELWDARLQEIAARIVNALVDMGDVEGAARFLQTLPESTSASARCRLALVFLKAGDDVQMRESLGNVNLGELSHESLMEVLSSMSKEQYDEALDQLESIDHQSRPELSQVVTQMKAACLIYAGRIQEAKATVDSEFQTSTFPSPDVLYDLVSVFELCSEGTSQQRLGSKARGTRGTAASRSSERGSAEVKM